MSRLGKKDIIIPEGVELKIEDDIIKAKGPLGELEQALHKVVSVKVNKENNTFKVDVENPENKKQKALWGLYARLIENMLKGVHKGFEKALELNGVGFKMELKGDVIVFNLGFSHPIDFKLPEGIKAVIEGKKLTISGIDKQVVGQVAANIRSLKKPEPYKGKGLKYVDENIIRKAGKAAAKA